MEQRQRLCKAKIALALYAKYGKVPEAAEITSAYNQFSAQHADMFTAHVRLHTPQPHEQLTLLSLPPSLIAEHRRTRSFLSLS